MELPHKTGMNHYAVSSFSFTPSFFLFGSAGTLLFNTFLEAFDGLEVASFQ